MSYKPNLGDHAPGYLREVFCEYLESTDKSGTVKVDGGVKPVKWLLGQLWNCTDIMPAASCDELDMPRGSTYAMAARRVASSTSIASD